MHLPTLHTYAPKHVVRENCVFFSPHFPTRDLEGMAKVREIDLVRSSKAKAFREIGNMGLGAWAFLGEDIFFRN